MTTLKKVLIGAAVATGLVIIAKAMRKKTWADVFASKSWYNPKAPDVFATPGEVLSVSSDGIVTHRDPGVTGKFLDENTIQWSNGQVWMAA